MPKRLRDEEITGGSVSREPQAKKAKTTPIKGKTPPPLPLWKVEKREKRAAKKELRRQKRENKQTRSHPKNLAKYNDTPEQKAARKLAKRKAREALEAAQAAKAAASLANGDATPAGENESRLTSKALKLAAKKAVKQAVKAAKKASTDATAAQDHVEDRAGVAVAKEDKSPGIDTTGGAHVSNEGNPLYIVDTVGAVAQEKDDTQIANAESIAKAEKKARKLAKKGGAAAVNVQEENKVPDIDAAATLAKAEKKARKLAKKAETAAVMAVSEKDTTDTADAAADAKAEHKARRRAEKDAAKQTESNGHVNGHINGISNDSKPVILNANGTANPSEGYIENSELSALPTSEISKFLESKQITVQNSGPDRRPITLFKYLPVSDDAQRAPFQGFAAPTPIQAAAWPYLLDGRDVIGVAETGSGKTLAFGVPCIRRLSALDKKSKKNIKACIVSPTRELALQIQEQLAKFTAPFGLKVTCVYGGVSKDDQRAQLKGTHIVVATPGRLNDFIQEGSIDLSHVDYMVLDEADRMLDKGFEEEVRKIVSNTAATGRQTLMFTATWPPSVRDLASTFMTNPVRINIGENTTGELRANTRIVQEVEVIDPAEKQNRLFQLLKQYQSGKNKNDRILVFCLYKKEATRIEEFIRRRGFNVAGIHGDLSQQKRQESLESFKTGTVPILVATDVAARGLDIPAVKLVINVTFPLTAEDYVHRIGRTGRAGQDGHAITFFTDEEKALAGALINVLKGAGQPVPEELLKYGTTVKKKAHDAYGAFYKDTSDAKAATKITFD